MIPSKQVLTRRYTRSYRCPMADPLNGVIRARMNRRDIRRLFALARKIEVDSVSDLVRDIIKRGVLAPPSERVMFYQWLSAKLDNLEQRQMLIEQVRVAHTQQGVAKGLAATEGRSTRGAV